MSGKALETTSVVICANGKPVPLGLSKTRDGDEIVLQASRSHVGETFPVKEIESWQPAQDGLTQIIKFLISAFRLNKFQAIMIDEKTV